MFKNLMQITPVGWICSRIRADGDAMRDARQWAEAARLYTKYLRYRPTDAAIWVQRGNCEKESGSLYDASRSYERAVTIAPNVADTWLQIGHLRKLQGRFPEAAANYARALAKDPALVWARQELQELGYSAIELENVIADPHGAQIANSSVEETTSIGETASKVQLGEADEVVRRISIHSRHIERLLELLSTVKAIGFRLSRQERRFDEVSEQFTGIEKQINTHSGHIDRRLNELLSIVNLLSSELGTYKEAAAGVEEHVAIESLRIERLLGLLSTVKAVGFGLSRQERHLDEVSVQLAAAEKQIETHSRQIERLPELVSTAEKTIGLTLSRQERHFDEVSEQFAAVEKQVETHSRQIESLPGLLSTTETTGLTLSRQEQRLEEIVKLAAVMGNRISGLEAEISTVNHLLADGTITARSVETATVRLDELTDLVDRRIEALRDSLATVSARLEHVTETSQTGTRAIIGELSEHLTRLGEEASTKVVNAMEVAEVALRRVEVVDATSVKRFETVDQQLTELAAQVETMRLAAEGAPPKDQITRMEGSLSWLSGRVEFVRREMMLEFHHGHGGAAAKLETPPKILSPEKIAAAMLGTLKLNVGCGHLPLPGYINVDRRELPGVDIVAEADKIPLASGSVDELYAAHLVEYFPQEMFIRSVLPSWIHLLKPRGSIVCIVPDGEAMMRDYGAGSLSFEHFREVLFGSQDYIGDYHFNLLTPGALEALLKEAGFTDFELIAAGRPNGICLEFELRARLSARAFQIRSRQDSRMPRIRNANGGAPSDDRGVAERAVTD